MSGSGRVALPGVWQLSGDPSECSGVVGGPFGCSRVVWRPSRMSGNGRETLPNVQEALWAVWECSEGPLGCEEVVGRPSGMCGSGLDGLQDVRVWSGGPPGCLEVVGRPSRRSGSGGSPSRMSWSGCDALPDAREWSENPTGCTGGPLGCSGGPLGCPGVVWRFSRLSVSSGRPSWMSGIGREALTYAREWLGVSTGCSGVFGMPFRMSRSGRESLPDVLK